MTLISANKLEWMGNVTTKAAALIPRKVMSYSTMGELQIMNALIRRHKVNMYFCFCPVNGVERS